jgi:hypothetical protein
VIRFPPEEVVLTHPALAGWVPCHEKEVKKSLRIKLLYSLPGLVPGIHVSAPAGKTWMAGLVPDLYP